MVEAPMIPSAQIPRASRSPVPAVCRRRRGSTDEPTRHSQGEAVALGLCVDVVTVAGARGRRSEAPVG
eukprot:613888-Rhodomonas_salina.3